MLLWLRLPVAAVQGVYGLDRSSYVVHGAVHGRRERSGI
jgi:hypothetical protein